MSMEARGALVTRSGVVFQDNLQTAEFNIADPRSTVTILFYVGALCLYNLNVGVSEFICIEMILLIMQDT